MHPGTLHSSLDDLSNGLIKRLPRIDRARLIEFWQLIDVSLGHVDPGESDMETALRETQEEAGFTSSDLRIFEDARHEMTYQVKGMPKTVIYWLAELLNPDKSVRLSNEHQAFEWLSLREACDLAKYAEMQKALNEFDKYISQNLA